MPHIKNALIRYRIIDRCLRNSFKPFPSKSEIREACEESLFGQSDGENICDSTIEKDMFAMKMELDAPIKYSKKNLGYFYTDSNFSLDEVPLTEDDLEAIRFATNTLTQFKDVGMFKQFGHAIEKIVDSVSIASNQKEDTITKYVQFEVPIKTKGAEFLNPLLIACRDKKAVYFDYESFQTQKSKPRKVLPLLLKEYRNRWYCISQDLTKDTIITYALDRITNLENSDEDVLTPVLFKSEQFFKHSVGITASNEEPKMVVFKASNVAAKYIESQPFHSSQIVSKTGKNKTTFELFVFITEELIRTLLSYGGEIEVVEPASLRIELVKRAKSMLEQYNS